MGITSGELRHRVTITAPAGVLAADAVTVESTVPMAIEAVQAQEILAAGGQQASTNYRLKCRYRTDLTESLVLTEACCTARTFQIVAIVPSDRLDAIELKCIESRRAS